jgi:hypothetical protein
MAKTEKPKYKSHHKVSRKVEDPNGATGRFRNSKSQRGQEANGTGTAELKRNVQTERKAQAGESVPKSLLPLNVITKMLLKKA